MKNSGTKDIYSREFIIYKTILGILERIDQKGAYANILINSVLNKNNYSPKEKAVINETANQVIIWKKKLDWIIKCFFDKDIKKLDPTLKYILWIGIYLIYIKNDPKTHAVVDGLVEFTKRFFKVSASKLINAILRNLIRQKDSIEFPDENRDMLNALSVKYSHPGWMVNRWLERYGLDNTRKILNRNNHPPDLSLRVNIRRTTIEKIENYLRDKNINFTRSTEIPEFLLLDRNFPVIQSNIFIEGLVSIQDLSSGISPHMFNIEDYSSIFDICAAPGSKSFHLSEIYDRKNTIFSVDINTNRIKLLLSDKKRLKTDNIFTTAADGRNLPFNSADNVLLDVPCSSTGTLNKRSDLRWHITEEEINNISKLQKDLISGSAEILKPGGQLVYSTCTIEQEENEDVINWFISKNKKIKIMEPSFFKNSKLIRENNFVRTIQGLNDNMNGSFTVLLQKTD
ncbi:16S rRNA (cytosine(967)-C(5))-methyltransferase RsmB [candidate division KSB1 bacterium]